MSRRIAVVTTNRADYGILRPVLRRLRADPAVDLGLIVGGTHLDPAFGLTVTDILEDDMPIATRVGLSAAGGGALAVAEAMGRAVSGFARALHRLSPDLMVVLGDRYEMFAAAAAAQPLQVPLAHIHGGELTLGAMDDALRHAITKMSHLHFAATPGAAKRLVQMGEDPWRVTHSGAPGLDNLHDVDPLTGDRLAAAIGLPLVPAPLMVTLHPTTREPGRVDAQADALLAALDGAGRPCVLTAPNADPGGAHLMARLRAHAAGRADVSFVDHLGTRAYFGLMAAAAAMVGNSSSGIIEAASFRLPVVNIGTREGGRERGANVIDVEDDAAAIATGIARALSPGFRAGLHDLRNPYRADRPAAEIIHARLVDVPLDDRLRLKGFHDL